MLGAKEIRESFKNFFASKGHQIVPSAPMVIKDDPSLMFTNAGMNQFKNIFLGQAPAKYLRVANSQKCLRVSGKHNDLEEVGHDTYPYHVRNVGRWSCDYFKRSHSLGLGIHDQVLKSMLRGFTQPYLKRPEEGLQRDDEAAGYWANYLPRNIITAISTIFQEMSETGPCWTLFRNSYRFTFRAGAGSIGRIAPGQQKSPPGGGNLEPGVYAIQPQGRRFPRGVAGQHIDTGMGFERLCMAVQGKTSNYDTDLFQPLIKEIGNLCDVPYGRDQQTDVAMRVVADHIRTIAFSITDGQLPSNTGAGYVIRRILRRAVRYAYTFLGRRRAFCIKRFPYRSNGFCLSRTESSAKPGGKSD